MAINDVDGLIGSRERFGDLLYQRFITEDKPTKHFFRVWDNVYPHSLVRNAEVSFVACMARIAAVELLADGTLNANQEDRDKG